MENSDMTREVFQYKTQGVCSQLIQIAVNNDIIEDVQFMGGCHGNLQGIGSLVKGMKIEEVISKLQGIKCGGKSTSCPDQLSQALIAYKNHKMQQV